MTSPGALRLAGAAAFALAAAGASLAQASSTMFKCVEGGRTIYQQQACKASPQAEGAASAPRVAGRSSTAADAASAIRRPSPAASSAPATPR